MNTVRYIFSIALFALCLSAVHAKPIEMIQDFAQFRGDSQYTRLEMYYMIDDTALKYVYKDSRFGAELYMRAVFSPTVGETISEEWILADAFGQKKPDDTRILIGQRSFYLKPGQYIMEISLRDLNDTSTQARFSTPIVIRDFTKKNFILSDIEFCSKISYLDSTVTNPQFRKGQLMVAPNPVKIYAGQEPTLTTYTEIYGAKKSSPGGYKVSYAVLDAARREVFAIPFERSSVADAQVEKIELPLTALATGTYYLRITAFSSDGLDSTSSISRFYLQSDIPAEIERLYTEDEQFLMSEFATLDEGQLRKEIEYLQYIATEGEKVSFTEMTDKIVRQKLLFRFWYARDPQPGTLVNERLTDYRNAMVHANQYFSNLQIKEGWRTDRGRVLMKYGFPTQIDRNNVNVDGKPYETWFYPQLQGGGIFIFVDIQGYNNYRLVHSTIPGEVYDPNWQENYQKIRPETNNSMNR